MEKGDIVQFNENHKWCGCLGIIKEIKRCGNSIRFMVGVPIPQQGTAYIFVSSEEVAIEKIGKAKLVALESED